MVPKFQIMKVQESFYENGAYLWHSNCLQMNLFDIFPSNFLYSSLLKIFIIVRNVKSMILYGEMEINF